MNIENTGVHLFDPSDYIDVGPFGIGPLELQFLSVAKKELFFMWSWQPAGADVPVTYYINFVTSPCIHFYIASIVTV